VGDEPTLGELGRRLDDRISDVRDDIAQLGRRLDGKVDAALYEVKHTALIKEVSDVKAETAALRAERVQDANRVANTRRWLIGAVIVPLVVVLLAYLLPMGGKG
jgi:hypothetical protein